MKRYITLMFMILYLGETYCQNNGLYLTVQNLKEINGNYIIKATDVEKHYTDTLTLISFKNTVYINGQLKNQIDSNYGNLQKLIKGSSYIFRLFKPIIQVSSKSDFRLKLKNSTSYICLSGNDTLWIGNNLKESPYGIANGLADTIQYFNPILPANDFDENNQLKSYKIIKIDSINNVYILSALRSDTLYKILSYKDSSSKCRNIFIYNTYRLSLKSLFIRGFTDSSGRKFDITPEAVHGLTGLEYHGVSVSIDNLPNQKRDLFEATNLKALCLND